MKPKVNLKNSDIKHIRENSLGWLLKMLSQKIDRIMAKELSKMGLNINFFAVLMTLLEKEDLTQTELGKAVGVPGYTTTRTLDRLEEMEFVQRRPDPNSRRAHRIFLTKQGRDIGKNLPALVKKVNSDFSSSLTFSHSYSSPRAYLANHSSS